MFGGMGITSCSLLYVMLCLLNCYLSSANKNSKRDLAPEKLENLLNTGQYEKFSRVLRIPNPDLVRPSQRKNSLDELYFYNGLELADILLRPGQVRNADQSISFSGHLDISINTWENGSIPYYIGSGFSEDHKSFMSSGIEEVNQLLEPNVHFRPYQDGDVDYVFIFPGGCGCYTNLGHVGGPQAISMSDPCFVRGFFIHELQHTLGIGHEHNRADRSHYIRIHEENIPEVLKSQYEKYTSSNYVNIGPFDYYSIMMYPVAVPGFNLTAFDVFDSKIDNTRLGDEKTLTQKDIKRVKKLYSSK